MTLQDSPCSVAELCVDTLSLLCTATGSDALGPPLLIELDVLLLLWRKIKQHLSPSHALTTQFTHFYIVPK